MDLSMSYYPIDSSSFEYLNVIIAVGIGKCYGRIVIVHISMQW